jgi:hypothetical protein
LTSTVLHWNQRDAYSQRKRRRGGEVTSYSRVGRTPRSRFGNCHQRRRFANPKRNQKSYSTVIKLRFRWSRRNFTSAVLACEPCEFLRAPLLALAICSCPRYFSGWEPTGIDVVRNNLLEIYMWLLLSLRRLSRMSASFSCRQGDKQWSIHWLASTHGGGRDGAWPLGPGAAAP